VPTTSMTVRNERKTLTKGTEIVVSVSDTATNSIWPFTQDDDNKSALVRNLHDSTGWRPPSAYTRRTEKYQAWTGEWWRRTSNASYDFLDRYYPTPDTVAHAAFIPPLDRTKPFVSSNEVDRAIIKCKLKIKDQVVNYATTIAESKQTFELLYNSVTTLFKAYKLARKGYWLEAARTLGVPPPALWKHGPKQIAERWLELQYGWIPLLNDVRDVYEDCRRRVLVSPPRFSATATVIIPLKSEYMVKSPQGAEIAYTERGKKVARVRLDYMLRNDMLQKASQIGLLNPAEVAWELTGFSFVIDWLVPIGSWISSWDSDLGLTFKSGTLTKFVQLERYGAIQHSYKPGVNKAIAYADLFGHMKYSDTNRSVYTTAPVSLPYWKNPFSGIHVANAIALLVAGIKLH
jgi:hypothetical protein